MRLLTLARDLGRRKARERHELFVAEGIRAVEELLRSPLTVVGALASPQLDMTARGVELRRALEDRSVEVAAVGASELASAADTESPQGVLAIAEVPQRSLGDLDAAVAGPSARLLVLDALQDPGNVGTVLRTAAALGWGATICLPGTVDVWNAKVVRSAMGAHFHHLAVGTTWPELEAFRSSAGLALWGADTAGEPLGRSAAPARLAVAVGNEGAGLSAPIRAAADRLVSLEMAAGVESLNAAVAAGIFLYELRR
jgi:RNA methyltransferase, TrmH family